MPLERFAGQFFASAMTAVWVIYGVFPVFLVIYLVARWRALRDPTHADGELGLKTAFHYFKTLGFQTVLFGLFLLGYGVLENSGDAGRIAAGLLLAGLIGFTAFHYALTSTTNDPKRPMVRRLFHGFNVVLDGVIAFAALAVACVMLFQKRTPEGVWNVLVPLLLVYVIAWGVQTWMLYQAGMETPIRTSRRDLEEPPVE